MASEMLPSPKSALTVMAAELGCVGLCVWHDDAHVVEVEAEVEWSGGVKDEI